MIGGGCRLSHVVAAAAVELCNVRGRLGGSMPGRPSAAPRPRRAGPRPPCTDSPTMRSTFGLEVIKLAILKAASLMSVVMKSDTFTGTAICKARSTTRERWRGKKTHKYNVNTAAASRKSGSKTFLFYCVVQIYKVAVVLVHC